MGCRLVTGIVGLGWWGKELARAAASSGSQVTIEACFSPDPGERSEFAERYDARPHESYESLLADDSLDAVLIATPHSAHGAHIALAAEAGKHVFVEKPITLTSTEGREVIEYCHRRDVMIAVGHNRRFAPAAQALRKMVAEGAFGRILHVEGHFSTNSAMRYQSGQWRSQRSEAICGAMCSVGIHVLDTMMWILGPVARLSCISRRQAVPVEIDDTTAVLLEFQTGHPGYLASLFACPMTSYFRLYGTAANAMVTEDFSQLRIQPADGKLYDVELPEVDTVSVELNEFATACRDENPFSVSPDSALQNIIALEAMDRSARLDGEWVSISY